MPLTNPYAPPEAGEHDDKVATPLQEGSYRLGVVLGFLLGVWGLIGCLALAQYDTKRGAKHGFLGRLGIVVLAVIGLVIVDVAR